MFERIGDALPRFNVVERLFAEHDAVLAALSNAYVDILRFCIKAKDVCLAGGTNRLWKPFTQQFDIIIDEFRRHQKVVRDEMHVAHMIESKKSQELELRDRTLQEQRRRVEERLRMLDRLCKLNYRSQHRRLQRIRLEGTGSWFTEDIKFRTWVESKESGSFACYGIPGSGKTILASCVVDKMSAFFTDMNSAVCYHYCDYSERTSLDITTILGSLARQLLERIEIPERVQALIQKDEGHKKEPEDLEEILLDVLSSFANVLLVIDGLDELDHSTQDWIIRTSRNVVQGPCASTKMLLLCRSEEMKIKKAFKDSPSLSITPSNVLNDVGRFIGQTIDSKIDSGDLAIDDQALRDHIVSQLRVESADM